MQIPKCVFGLYRFTDDEAQRYALDGIMFHRAGDGSPIAVATNGEIMVAVTWGGDDVPPPKAFQVIVPAAACQQMFAYGGWDDVYRVRIDEAPEDPARCSMSTHVLDVAVFVEAAVLEGRFPHYQNNFEPRPSETVVKLSVPILTDVLEMFTETGIKSVVFGILNHESHVTLTGTSEDGVSIAVALMSKFDDSSAPVPVALGWTPGPVKAKSLPLDWTSYRDAYNNEQLEAKAPCRHDDKQLYWRLNQRYESDRVKWHDISDDGIDQGGRDWPSWPSRQEAIDAIQKAHDTIMQSMEADGAGTQEEEPT